MICGIHGECFSLGWSMMDFHIGDGLLSGYMTLVGY